jgi:hypothetical protein
MYTERYTLFHLALADLYLNTLFNMVPAKTLLISIVVEVSIVVSRLCHLHYSCYTHIQNSSHSICNMHTCNMDIYSDILSDYSNFWLSG